VTVAYKEGKPTPAAHAFAKKVGVSVEQLLTTKKAKGEYISARTVRKGRSTPEILAAELPREVLSIYWAKNMYWRAGKPERFVRPVRWVVALLDSTIVPLEIAGIAAGRLSRGHRILHGEAPVSSAASASAGLLTPPPAPSPARAGARTSLWSKPSPISPSGLRSSSATSRQSTSSSPKKSSSP
jgi:glycyl-tRNA synthetase beta subunit